MALHVENWPWQPSLVWLNRIVGARSAAARPAAARPPLARGERILAAVAPDVFGSTRALYCRSDDRPDGWVRTGWEELDRARWHAAEGTLVLTHCPGDEREPITLRLPKPGRLPEVIRDRITAAVLITSVVALDPGQARITVRRRLGTDGLVWTVQLASGLDPGDSGVRRRVDTAIRAMRADLGLHHLTEPAEVGGMS